jgi:hypothetical protein
MSSAAWAAAIEGLRDLPQRMLDKVPQTLRDDPQIVREVERLALEALIFAGLDAVGGNGDYPVFLPMIGQVVNIGQPNADTIYRQARITPGGSYRLTGRRGSLRIATVGQFGPWPFEQGSRALDVGPARNYGDVNSLKVDAEGRFDVLLSVDPPAGYAGDWWPLLPTTNKLLLRLVSADWDREQDLTISIERVDRPMARQRTTALELDSRMRMLPAETAFLAMMLLDHVEELRREGYVNKLKVFDTTNFGGLQGQFYYEGAYELGDDEALILETRTPVICHYWSVILTNAIYETTNWTDNHSSLNDAQAQPDGDGVLRIVVSARDPGVPNWLNTAGYRQGVIQGRWMNCDTNPIPSVRRVAFAEVRAALSPETPAITPDEREAVIRARRRAFQQRPLW